MRLLPTKMGAVGAAVALFVSSASAQTSGLPCFDETEMQSARIHDLRVMLMVNSLKCRQLSPTTLQRYGTLLDQRWDELAVHGDNVEQSLIARYGPRHGRLAFDDYETRIGNYHSGFQPSRERCQDINTYVKLAKRASHGELETLSKLATNRSITTCRVAEETPFAEPDNEYLHGSANTTAAIAAAARMSEPETPQMVDGVPTYMTPGTGLESPAEPAEAVAVVDPVETVPAPTASDPSADKLGQAITALDAAAAALRDLQQSGGPPTD